jgi:hypothetical protein
METNFINVEITSVAPKEIKPKYLNDLTSEQLQKIAEANPKWVFENRPYFMSFSDPVWVSKFAPGWLADHDPKYMLTWRMDWMCFHRPDIVAKFELEVLVEKNPYWAVKNIPEALAYTHPDLLKEYDAQLLQQHAPEEHKVTSTFIGRLKNKISKTWQPTKAQGLHNPSLPSYIADLV